MAGELATVNHAGGLAEVTYTREQVDLIKRTICVDATDDELRLFLARCAKTGLDPFMRQIYSIKRGGKHTIQVGIDGLRLVAVRSGDADGQDGPYWCGADGVWRDTWLDQSPPSACRVVVYRKGQSRGYTGVVHLREYFQQNNGLWKSMPAQMLAKAAEAVALRKAFPQELSGLYADAEMDQADAPPPVVQQPPPLSPAAVALVAEIEAAKNPAELQAAGEAIGLAKDSLLPTDLKPLRSAYQRRGKQLAPTAEATA